MHLWLTKSKGVCWHWRWEGVGVWWDLSSSFPRSSSSVMTFKCVRFLLAQNFWKPAELHVQWVLFGGRREGGEVGGRVKTVRRKRCEVLQRYSSLELKCVEISISQSIPENLDIFVLCLCEGQNLVLYKLQGNSPPRIPQPSQGLEKWSKSFLK